jgi:phage gp46-like protein
MMPALLHRFDNLEQRGDISQVETGFAPFTGNLATDEGLISLVELSLFTDRRAPPGVDLPGGPLDLRGWWGDQFWGESFDLPQYQIGSLIWTLDRSKNRAETLALLRDYAVDAVKWMVDILMIDRAVAISERVDNDTAAFQLQLFRPNDPDALWSPRWRKTISGI